ncbi:phage tail protein [Pseudomonas sp. AL 58]|jgi:microcystin-dependent protein|uniref:phage tail protein n=1 Tax=Pseudomonas sp. AL 58 TaxID=3104275 RepID=UPI002EB180D4|nr:tail fiber protein [Pseudomonas sp. AL 58]
MSDYFLGEIRWFPTSWAPSGWLACDGRDMPIAQNQALYALLGTRYGGNGVTTFKLPDLRGRAALHCDAGKPDYSLAVKAGTETVTLTAAQMPAHTHAFNASTAAGTVPQPKNNFLAHAAAAGGVTDPHLYGTPGTPAAMIPLNGESVSVSGSSAAHTNMQPFLVLNPCIAVSGIFPPRS